MALGVSGQPAARGRNEFVAMLTDLFAPLGHITARRMFGGWGIYCDGIVFGLVADDVLFLKADDLCRDVFEARHLDMFYPQGPEGICISYYEIPGDWLEDEDDILPYARVALDAGLRASRTKKTKKKKTIK
ncbi:TfoX/Sxy family protein [Thalassospira profundimaris]|nr:TfoX/Sxy family protein [Thalassospira profundimaris]